MAKATTQLVKTLRAIEALADQGNIEAAFQMCEQELTRACQWAEDLDASHSGAFVNTGAGVDYIALRQARGQLQRQRGMYAEARGDFDFVTGQAAASFTQPLPAETAARADEIKLLHALARVGSARVLLHEEQVDEAHRTLANVMRHYDDDPAVVAEAGAIYLARGSFPRLRKTMRDYKGKTNRRLKFLDMYARFMSGEMDVPAVHSAATQVATQIGSLQRHRLWVAEAVRLATAPSDAKRAEIRQSLARRYDGRVADAIIDQAEAMPMLPARHKAYSTLKQLSLSLR